MNLPALTLPAIAACCTIALVSACGGDESVTERSFCESMEQTTHLLEPQTASTTRADTRERYLALEAVLERAQRNAPAPLRDDVVTFATAINRFATALATVDYDIDDFFSTPAGVQLGEETSHALTPALVGHLTGPCGVDLP